MRWGSYLVAMAALLLSGCDTPAIKGDSTVEVKAIAETVPVGTVNQDAADDPAIWYNAADPAASLLVATDKKAGLYVYGLDGMVRHFLPAGTVNNVDLIELQNGTILVAASDRTNLSKAHIFLASLDPSQGELAALDRIAVGQGEGYGICFGELHSDGAIEVFSPVKDGTIYRTLLRRLANGEWQGDTTRLFSVPSQPEGCVHDGRADRLYVGEEAAGIWIYDLRKFEGRLAARVDDRQLVADVEGLALAPEGADGGWLIASSQGDNSFARFRLPDLEPAGRFRIGAGEFGAVEETDGIALDNGNFGPRYPGGLFIAQDGQNAPGSQNFKLVSWRSIEEALTRRPSIKTPCERASDLDPIRGSHTGPQH
ncbi:MAG: 3-phytase [Erythrobacter sp.]|nr:3-phytase [Erythrobacter sp.]